MFRKKTKIKLKKPERVQYTEPKPIFSNKEIIFRSGGRAKVFNISSKLQVFILAFFIGVGLWSAYSYYLYSVSDKIISHKDKELGKARDDLVDLMADFGALFSNVSSMFSQFDGGHIKDETDLNRYKQQASVVEEKIRQIADNEEWIEDDDFEKQVTVREALLQRDRALSERDELVNRIVILERNVALLENSEMEILNQVEKISQKEMEKMKAAISDINKSMKKQNKYFNPLANSKKDSTGGNFEPDIPAVNNEDLSKKMQEVFSLVNDTAYYKGVLESVPVGKPVWSYWVSSPFGKRADPFNKKSAAHKGVDLASNTGNKIKTMAKGKVVRSDWNGGYGKYVEIDHGNGFKTKYAHLHNAYVKKGQYVEQGEAIGEVGSTGRSTGPHLHYEVLYNGTPVDPMAFMKIQL